MIYSFRKLFKVKKNKEQFLSANDGVAQAIKKKRKEANLTQGEIAKGICSISYLSKIENGKCHPDNYYVQEICNRMDIDISSLIKEDYTDILKKVLHAYLMADVEKFESLIANVEEYSISSKLICLLNDIRNKNKTEPQVEYLNAFKSTMSDYELSVFIYLVSLIHLREKNYVLSLQYAELLEEIDFDKTIGLLRQLVILDCNLGTGEYTKVVYLGNKLLSNSEVKYNLVRTAEIKEAIALALIATNNLEYSRELLHELNHKSFHKLYSTAFLEARIWHKEQKYQRALHCYTTVQNKYETEAKLSIMELCVLTKDKNLLLETKKQVLSQNIPLHIKMAEYFDRKLSSSTFEVKDYVSQHLLPLVKRSCHRYYFEIIKEDLIVFYRSRSRYKAIDELRNQFK